MRLDKYKLLVAMDRKGFNQKQAAEAIGIARATFNFIYNGKSCADTTAMKIAKALDVDLSDLLEK